MGQSGSDAETVAQLTFKKVSQLRKARRRQHGQHLHGHRGRNRPRHEIPIGRIGVGKLTAMRDVAINVTNKKEDGKIKFSSNHPKQGVEFIATLTDDDGPTTVTKWQWQRDPVQGVKESPTPDCLVAEDEDWVRCRRRGRQDGHLHPGSRWPRPVPTGHPHLHRPARRQHGYEQRVRQPRRGGPGEQGPAVQGRRRQARDAGHHATSRKMPQPMPMSSSRMIDAVLTAMRRPSQPRPGHRPPTPIWQTPT